MNRSSATGMASRYQPSQFLALSPATKSLLIKAGRVNRRDRIDLINGGVVP
jgi:hypothetical protein